MCFFLLKSNESCRRNRSLTIVFHLSCILLTNGDCSMIVFFPPLYFLRHGWTYGDDLSGMIQKLRFFNSNNRPCRYTWCSWRTQVVIFLYWTFFYPKIPSFSNYLDHSKDPARHIPEPDHLPRMLPPPLVMLDEFFTTKNSTASGDWFGYRGHRWLFSF